MSLLARQPYQSTVPASWPKLVDHELRVPIFKDGKPGWITGYDSTISDGDFADIEMEDGRQTFVRLPDYGGRITPREVAPC